MHLNTQHWSAWLEGRMEPNVAAALSEHMEPSCLDCEDFLEELPIEAMDLVLGVESDEEDVSADLGADALNEAYATVMERVRVLGVAEAPEHARPWHQALPFTRRFESRSAAPRRGLTPSRKAAGMFSGVVTAAALMIMLTPTNHVRESAPTTWEGEDVWNGEKGLAGPGVRGGDLSLLYAVARGGQVVRPGRNGDLLLADADLLFRFRIDGEPQYVYLVQDVGDQRRLLWPLAGREPLRVSGEQDLVVDGVVHGVPLKGLDGNVRFTAIASPQRLTDPLSLGMHGENLSTVKLSVRVAPVPELSGP